MVTVARLKKMVYNSCFHYQVSFIKGTIETRTYSLTTIDGSVGAQNGVDTGFHSKEIDFWHETSF